MALHSHEPAGYVCPFCVFARGEDEALTWNREADLVHRDEAVLAFVSPEQWPRNAGHVLVIPAAHHENLYTLPLEIATRIHWVSRAVALAMKRAWACDGTSTRQHNEPAGNQEIWHYHFHVFPRWDGDRLYTSRKARVAEPKRAVQAEELRAALRALESAQPSVRRDATEVCGLS